MKKMWVLIFGMFFIFQCFAAIEYDAVSNTIMANGYPEDYPCTAEMLYRMDQLFKWGKMTYDEAAQTWKINCNLLIGDNNGTTTYFQIGSKNLPNETVIVNGFVRVKSIWLIGENKEIPYGAIRALKFINRLTIGDPKNPEIKAALKIDNDVKKGHPLVIGGFTGYGSKNYGGQLHIYNGTIESAGKTPLGFGGKVSYGAIAGGNTGIIMKNAKFANVNRGFAHAFCSGIFENTIFDNSGFSANYQEIMKGCSFENNPLAIHYGGARKLTLYDCIFKNNKFDWRIYGSRIVAIDCEYENPEKNAYTKRNNKIPYFVSKRHIIVKVVNKKGRPVNRAKIQCIPNIKPKASEYDVPNAVTNKTGTTPGKDAKGALLLTQSVVDGPKSKEEKPVRQDLIYTIEASAGNKKAVRENFKPEKSWEIIELTLE